jgi:hypothetical protein
VSSRPAREKLERPYLKKKVKKVYGIAQVVECLPTMHRTPIIPPKKIFTQSLIKIKSEFEVSLTVHTTPIPACWYSSTGTPYLHTAPN